MLLAAGASFGIGLLTYKIHLERRRRALGLGLGSSLILPQIQASEGEGGGEEGSERKLKGWELRYKDFASLFYRGERYMTAQDFLESITQDRPRGRLQHVADRRSGYLPRTVS